MTKLYLTAPHGRSPQSTEEVLAEWNDGKPFKIYQSGGLTATINDVVRMKMSGVTHIHFVFQLEDLRVLDHCMELK